jgi:hypothetical protein
MLLPSVADPDQALFYPFDSGSGTGMNFFRIPELFAKTKNKTLLLKA